MMAQHGGIAADPLLQWRWPPLRQGIGRRWSLKVSERFSAHWHWLPMAHFEAAAGQPWQQGFIRADEVPPAHHCDREHGSEPAEAQIRAHGRFDRDLPAATAGPPPAWPPVAAVSYLRFHRELSSFRSYLRFLPNQS